MNDEKSSTFTYFLACCLAWLGQLYLVLFLPQLADEAYYSQWSKSLDVGFFDHPPAVALWSAWGGRLLNLTLLPLAWINFALAARKLGAQSAPHLLLLIAWCTPLGLASGVLLTPDAPLLLSWSIAVLGYAYSSILMMSIGFALGLWSKAMIIPAMFGILWLLWTDQRSTQRKRCLKVLTLLVIATALYSPHLYWSVTHQGLPWSFQGGRTWKPFSFFEFIAGQLWVGGGLWLIYLVLAYREVYLSWRLGQLTQKDRIFFALSAPSFLTFFVCSFLFRIEANWTALAWPMGLAWLLEKRSKNEIKRAWKLSTLITVPCLALPLIHTYLPLAWGPPRDGEALKECLNSVVTRQHSFQFKYWVAGRYQEASLLGLGLTEHSKVIFLEQTLNQYETQQIEQVKLFYLKANQRRQSQYDLSVQHLKSLTQEEHCQTLWLGPTEWFTQHCTAVPIPIEDHDRRCRLKLSRCPCSND